MNKYFQFLDMLFINQGGLVNYIILIHGRYDQAFTQYFFDVETNEILSWHSTVLS